MYVCSYVCLKEGREAMEHGGRKNEGDTLALQVTVDTGGTKEVAE